jgi:NTE family protein/lysophospholipid hydrolase
LPKLFGLLDESQLDYIKKHAEWIHLNRGEILCRQGDPGDCLYIVISGKVQIVREEEDHEKKKLNEAGRGEILGEMALLTGGLRSASIMATRDSYLAKIPGAAFEKLAVEHPWAILSIGRTLAQRILKAEKKFTPPAIQINLAIVTPFSSLPMTEFTDRLIQALNAHFQVFHLNSLRMNSLTGMPQIAKIQTEDPIHVRLSAWFDELEAKNDIMVYEGDISPTAWTRRCLQNADKVLVLVPGDVKESHIDQEMMDLLQTAGLGLSNMVLIFIHGENAAHVKGSMRWLSMIPSQGHYHLRWNNHSDMERIARFLTGKSVNLVLSGGAACGMAHIGCIHALEENHIPIDSISGTSIGAVIASQYAMGMGYSDLVKKNRWLCLNSKPMRDLTLPFISFLRGQKIEQVAKKVFGETRIEDLWLPFFCVSTNITSAEPIIHSDGSLFNAIRATTSVPGLVPPVIRNNEILVDGGIVNNLPVDIARNLYKGIVIAVDVTDAKRLSFPQPEFPPPWRIIRNKIFPSKDKTHVPNILDIIYRSAVVGSRHKTDKAKIEADLYLRLPVDCFKFLEFESFDKIINAGYQHAKVVIQEWKEAHNYSFD